MAKSKMPKGQLYPLEVPGWTVTWGRFKKVNKTDSVWSVSYRYFYTKKDALKIMKSKKGYLQLFKSKHVYVSKKVTEK